jgi:hypothetical protein
MSYRIRMQADDFFKAHEVLSENFASAPITGVGPSVVCLAFSIELYFKDLYDVLDMKPPLGKNGHNLLKLFEGLPEETQREIFSHGEIGTQNPRVIFGSPFAPKDSEKNKGITDLFIYELAAISDGFTDWRYSHEAKRAALHYNSGFALSLVKAVKAVCDRLRSIKLNAVLEARRTRL